MEGGVSINCWHCTAMRVLLTLNPKLSSHGYQEERVCVCVCVFAYICVSVCENMATNSDNSLTETVHFQGNLTAMWEFVYTHTHTVYVQTRHRLLSYTAALVS